MYERSSSAHTKLHWLRVAIAALTCVWGGMLVYFVRAGYLYFHVDRIWPELLIAVTVGVPWIAWVGLRLRGALLRSLLVIGVAVTLAEGLGMAQEVWVRIKHGHKPTVHVTEHRWFAGGCGIHYNPTVGGTWWASD